MIQTVIFDMDGVLIDSEPIHFEIEEQIFRELGISVPLQEHYGYVGTAAHNMWQAIITRYGLEAHPEVLAQKGRSRYLHHLSASPHVQPIAGVRELIEELHQANFTLLVASSSHGDVIDLVLQKLALQPYFAGRVSGADLAHSKPHPEIFLRSAQLAACDARSCVVIEDAENGVLAAKAANMACIGYQNPNSGVQDLSKADLIIRSFSEISARHICNM